MQFGQRSVRQGSKVAAGPSTCGDWKLRRISDGLASRVKGLTADFCVLLVTNPAPPRRLAVFSPSVAAAAKRLWWRQACDFRRRPVPPAIIRNQAGHGRPATPRPGRVLSVRRSPRFHRALSDRQGPARLPERVHCPSGSRISMTSTPVSIAWQRRRPPTWTRFRRSKIHHDVTKRPLSRLRCRAPQDVRGDAGLTRTNPDFAGTGTNHPFTMTMNPAVLSTKSFTPQVPLYH
jgi:hypothetical protein